MRVRVAMDETERAILTLSNLRFYIFKIRPCVSGNRTPEKNRFLSICTETPFGRFGMGGKPRAFKVWASNATMARVRKR